MHWSETSEDVFAESTALHQAKDRVHGVGINAVFIQLASLSLTAVPEYVSIRYFSLYSLSHLSDVVPRYILYSINSDSSFITFNLYLCGGEASVVVLLPCKPSDNRCGVTQVFSSRRGTEFGQQHIGADLHRQRG